MNKTFQPPAWCLRLDYHVENGYFSYVQTRILMWLFLFPFSSQLLAPVGSRSMWLTWVRGKIPFHRVIHLDLSLCFKYQMKHFDFQRLVQIFQIYSQPEFYWHLQPENACMWWVQMVYRFFLRQVTLNYPYDLKCRAETKGHAGLGFPWAHRWCSSWDHWTLFVLVSPFLLSLSILVSSYLF